MSVSPLPMAPPFHLAFPTHSIAAAREFYLDKLGFTEGRSSERWVDFNVFGHQLVAHLVDGYQAAKTHNQVDGDPVPVPHWGLALSVEQFHSLAARCRNSGITFAIHPHLRFKGAPGEQWTMFFYDCSGNALEFKALTSPANLFAPYVID